MELTGATAIVTGSSRGIGKGIAIELARRGCNVVVAARTVQESHLQNGTIYETVEEIESLGVRALAAHTDVTSEVDVRQMVTATMEAFGRIDILINNAGTMGDNRKILETSAAEWIGILGSNLFGAFHCCQAVLPIMVKQKQGAIINLTSGAAIRTGFLNVPYGVAKAGLDRLMRGIADDVKDQGIACFSISPGVVATDTVRRIYEDQDLSWTQPLEWTVRVTADVLENDPMSYTGQVIGVRQWIEEHL